MKLRKGDEVKIIVGKDAGKTGKIARILEKERKVLVPEINQFKRHLKARAGQQQSEIVTITKPIAVAKVALVCPKCKKVTRVGYRIEKDKKNRICKKCDAQL